MEDKPDRILRWLIVDTLNSNTEPKPFSLDRDGNLLNTSRSEHCGIVLSNEELNRLTKFVDAMITEGRINELRTFPRMNFRQHVMTRLIELGNDFGSR